jgi:DNA-binding CsgD family transcriptional regulator/N-acetylneuraminic acid mutarotase
MQNDLPKQGTPDLTEREQEILRLIASGNSNKDIAQQLFISLNTVKVHLRNIFGKIGVNSRTEAAIYALHIGLAKSPEATEQGAGNLSPEGNLLNLLESTPDRILQRPSNGVRLASVIAIIAILLVVVGVAFFLEKQYVSLPTSASQMPPTPASRWQVLASLPTARSGLAIAAYENQVYAIGGETTQGVTGVVERYDPATDSWAKMSRKPIPATDINAAVIGGKIYVPGGLTSAGSVTDALEVYDPRQDTWGEGQRLPVPMSAYAMTAFEGRLYLFGGWDGEGYLASVLVYDPGKDQWASLTSMHVARGFAGAAEAGGNIYVVGGINDNQVLALNEEYQPEHDTWSQRSPLPIGRFAAGMTSIADTIYVVGGEGEKGSVFIPMQYSPQKDQWQEFQDPTSQTWSHLGLVHYQTRIFGVGGQWEGFPAAQIMSYQVLYSILIPALP